MKASKMLRTWMEGFSAGATRWSLPPTNLQKLPPPLFRLTINSLSPAGSGEGEGASRQKINVFVLIVDSFVDISSSSY
jgi:hypothetical protein